MTDIPGQLGKLAALHAVGTLTDEEFAAIKAKLIAEMGQGEAAEGEAPHPADGAQPRQPPIRPRQGDGGGPKNPIIIILGSALLIGGLIWLNGGFSFLGGGVQRQLKFEVVKKFDSSSAPLLGLFGFPITFTATSREDGPVNVTGARAYGKASDGTQNSCDAINFAYLSGPRAGEAIWRATTMNKSDQMTFYLNRNDCDMATVESLRIVADGGYATFDWKAELAHQEKEAEIRGVAAEKRKAVAALEKTIRNRILATAQQKTVPLPAPVLVRTPQYMLKCGIHGEEIAGTVVDLSLTKEGNLAGSPEVRLSNGPEGYHGDVRCGTIAGDMMISYTAAVIQASQPFVLPAENYEDWRHIRICMSYAFVCPN